MPYIKQERRNPLDFYVKSLVEYLQAQPKEVQDGDMNYVISKMLREIYPLKYTHMNRAMGMLECVKQEFYRTVVGPYEDTKIIENGNVNGKAE